MVSPAPVPRNVVFDLGNVLLTWDPAGFVARYGPTPADVRWFVTHVTGSARWRDLDRGTCTLAEGRAAFVAECAGHPARRRLVETFFRDWLAIYAPVAPNARLLAPLKAAGHGVYVLSNFVREAYAHARETFAFFRHVDGATISSHVGACKPEPAIYRALLADHGLVAAETLFVDDLPENVAAARAEGLRAVWCPPGTDLRGELARRGLPV